MTRKKAFVGLERLEERALLSASSVTLQGGLLNIVTSPNQHHTAVVSQTNSTVQVQLDGQTYTFTDPVTQLNYTGGNKGDNFTNLTTIGGFLAFGNGNNVVNSKAGGEAIVVGNGKNFVQDFAAGNTIVAGNGQNNIYGGPGDTITAGSGRNIIYDILGSNQINVAPHSGTDYIFSNATSTVTGAQSNDRVATFFAAGRAAGSGTLVLDSGVLYFTANGNGDTYILNQVGNKLVATYNLNDGTGFHTQTFDKSDVKLIANFGGAGNDVLVNNTNIADVQYGAGGNNVVIGGYGALDLEKAGGASGNSLVVGRSPDYNDLTASLSAGATATLITNPNAKHNVARSVNPSDVIFGLMQDNGTYIGPLPASQVFQQFSSPAAKVVADSSAELGTMQDSLALSTTIKQGM
jgi:serralysin